MARRSVRVVVLLLIAVFMTIAAYSQITFRAESPVAPIGTRGCVQVGLFLNNPLMVQSFHTLTATLQYSADPGVLDGPPHARLSSFLTMPEPGLTNPATLQWEHGPVPMTMCGPMNTFNSVVLTGGMAIPFMPGTASGMVGLTENVDPMTQRIELVAAGAFNTLPMQDQLFAIITFPVTGQMGDIHLDFLTALPSANALIDDNMMTYAAVTTNGGVSLQEGASAIPTLSEWGVIAFMAGLLLTALFLLRRRTVTS
jgi:hypothetical protein